MLRVRVLVLARHGVKQNKNLERVGGRWRRGWNKQTFLEWKFSVAVLKLSSNCYSQKCFFSEIYFVLTVLWVNTPKRISLVCDESELKKQFWICLKWIRINRNRHLLASKWSKIFSYSFSTFWLNISTLNFLYSTIISIKQIINNILVQAVRFEFNLQLNYSWIKFEFKGQGVTWSNFTWSNHLIKIF